MLTHRLHGREDHDRIIAGAASWDAGGDPVPGLHVGDVCWALRDPDEEWDLHGWWADATLVGVALAQGPVLRPRVGPDHLTDPALATAVADTAEAMAGDQAWCDAQPGTVLRDVLEQRGWVDEGDDPWVCLHLDLRSWDDGEVDADQARGCVDDRVAVQRAGFDGSTYSVEKWRRMASTAAYRPELDLVVRDEDGTATATGTAWLGVAGGTAILEPVATHRDHRRSGHGLRVVRALAAACRDQGARGVNVWTPGSNQAAVALYRAAGFAVVTEVGAVWSGRRGGTR